MGSTYSGTGVGEGDGVGVYSGVGVKVGSGDGVGVEGVSEEEAVVVSCAPEVASEIWEICGTEVVSSFLHATTGRHKSAQVVSNANNRIPRFIDTSFVLFP